MSPGSLGFRWSNLQAQIKNAAYLAGRDFRDISVVAVSKLQPAEAIFAAVTAGFRHIGENRVQEAAAKRPLVDEWLAAQGVPLKAIEWHLIGTLQSNKAAKAARLFDCVQSLDNPKTARLLARTAASESRCLKVFVEVNTSGEASKSGVPHSEAVAFSRLVAGMEALQLQGLMTVGPLTEDEGMIRDSFDLLRHLRDELRQILPPDKFGGGLSMGMSGDFHIAIACGATVIRIGTALFGLRKLES
ncbi:MAG: YggS family pyridoxal phosphate-dependent enzyme [Crenarchaeota archaeon]|nr:YggS family pyridoxal phosphate-dependent enzyme [Thermoproteota archaeon]